MQYSEMIVQKPHNFTIQCLFALNVSYCILHVCTVINSLYNPSKSVQLTILLHSEKHHITKTVALYMKLL